MAVRQELAEAVEEVIGRDRLDQFRIDPGDFLSARELGEAVITRIDQRAAALTDAAEVVNRSFPERDKAGRFTNVISPLVMPHRRYSFLLLPMALVAVLGLLGSIGAVSVLDRFALGRLPLMLLGPHFWLLLLALVVFGWLRQSVVMVPDGCQALITRFGKLEEIAGAGRKVLLNPWKRVSYIVNTTREYPYNAPIREAPTASRVNASVDLFLQFRIENPAEFVFTLGSVKGFSDKLENAISELTRALIYEQRAEDIYDLVGENTQTFLESLNQQFLPAVRFMNANITHAEPSSQEYRIDLAAPEMLRVAKEAYTYQYELQLRKEQNEGELNTELASLRETLSGIRAEIAAFQAQMDTARERETNRASSYARQRVAEAKSAATANVALLEAQALDIRAVSSSTAPEILEYRYQQEVLERLASVADRLPQIVQVGDGDGRHLDFLAIARQLIGTGDEGLYTDADMQTIRQRLHEIEGRIRERATEIERLSSGNGATSAPRNGTPDEGATSDRVEQIRQSVSDERVQQRVERITQAAGDGTGTPDGNSPPAESSDGTTGQEGVR